MRLNPTSPLQLINGYGGINVDGFLGIGLFTNPFVSQPFTMLHLDDGGMQDTGYRRWMRQGLTCTHNSDLSYFGMKEESVSNTHTVVTWADNNLSDPGTDLLKFIFAGRPAAGGTAALLDGLEAARFVPAGSGNETYFGVGDWFTAGLNATERVDLLDGRLRIRQLPTDSAGADTLMKFLVVDDLDPASGEYGVVKWRYIPASTGCDWVVQSPDPHVSSVYPGGTCSWDMKHGVGIGLPSPKTKLSVYHTDVTLLTPTAISGDARFDFENGQEVIGVYGLARAVSSTIQSMNSKGVVGVAQGAKYMTGVTGSSRVITGTSGAATEVVGVQGMATMNSGASVTSGTVRGVVGLADAQLKSSQSIGVYGKGTGANSLVGSWGGYFEGRGFLGSAAWVYSDQNLKQNIEDVEGAAALQQIMQLVPKRYSFNTTDYAYLSLPEGNQIGLLSQQVQAVVPELVMDLTRPELLDSLGVVVEPALNFKAMNYDGLIPLLIGAVKEQQAMIIAQADLNAVLAQQLEQLQQQAQAQEALLGELQGVVASCCAGGDVRSLTDPINSITGDTRALLIQPNPFSEQTTLYYSLERSGRMQLMANSADGKQLRVLHEATLEAGQYQHEWHTSDLSPGVYYVTLLLDGEAIVKKAVKVTR